MTQFTTQGIVLARTDFGEADRIITYLTPDQGKIKAIAKGVRKSKAKLAGSVEPFGVSDISVIAGRGEINTLTSARLIRHYGNLIKDLERTSAGFELMKITNKATQDKPEEAYFDLLDKALYSLNDLDISPAMILMWFKMQLLRLSGQAPNLSTDSTGKKLLEDKNYQFDPDKMRFKLADGEGLSPDSIKFLRLGFGNNTPKALQRIQDIEQLVNNCESPIDAMLRNYIPI